MKRGREHLVSLKDLFDDLKDDAEREEVLEILRERAGMKKTAPSLPWNAPKWDWSHYPCIVGVKRVLEQNQGVLILAKTSLERKNTKARLFFLSFSNFDRVHEHMWPLLYRHVKDNQACMKQLRESRFWKQMRKKLKSGI